MTEIMLIVVMIDATGSMTTQMPTIKGKIMDISHQLKSIYPDNTSQIALITYRGHKQQIGTFKLTPDLNGFQQALLSIEASGSGENGYENITGALEIANKMFDESGIPNDAVTRVLLHIGDAPCHGVKFHTMNNRWQCKDPFPDGDPTGKDPLQYIQQLKGLHVKYFFLELDVSTQLMIREFNRAVYEVTDSQPYIETVYNLDITSIVRKIVRSNGSGIDDVVSHLVAMDIGK